MSKLTEKVDSRLNAIERRESQLWWLAVLLIVLLACALSAVDWSSAIQLGDRHPLSIALNTKAMRISLILSVLATSAYFRDTARRLRRTNNTLITDLQERTSELQRKNVEFSKLRDLSEEMIGLIDLSKALNLALDMAVDVVGADTASVMLRDQGSDILRVVAARGLPDEVVRRARVRMGDALSGAVAESGEAMILNSNDIEGRLRDRAKRTGELASAIIVPIRVDSEIRGVINISKRCGGTPFSQDDLRVLSTLANQAALVLRKIELWEDLQRQIVKLEEALAELKQTQAELVQSEKLASIGKLAGGMAHEINNPLQVIMGRVELMMETVAADSAERRHLTTIMEHVDRISSIVSALLRFARRQMEEERDPVMIDESVRDAIRLLENQLKVDDVKLEMDLNSPGCIVLGSRVKIQQVFMNLVLNAYQIMQASGGALRISSQANAREVVVTVTDTGPGIPPANLPHIFEPFFTTKAEGEGTGLGLFVTYGIVESHGGRIEASSDGRHGATFTVTFPIEKTTYSQAA